MTYEEYDSGPFCQHWRDAGDCGEMCQCGHECCDHVADGECTECDCKGFEGDD